MVAMTIGRMKTKELRRLMHDEDGFVSPKIVEMDAIFVPSAEETSEFFRQFFGT
jgi:hypothetical protein